jgi:hypothetical protein
VFVILLCKNFRHWFRSSKFFNNFSSVNVTPGKKLLLPEELFEIIYPMFLARMPAYTKASPQVVWQIKRKISPPGLVPRRRG